MIRELYHVDTIPRSEIEKKFGLEKLLTQYALQPKDQFIKEDVERALRLVNKTQPYNVYLPYWRIYNRIKTTGVAENDVC